MCEFRKRSDDLYRRSLGRFVVPSVFVAGQKEQGRGLEYKPYIIQPFLDCWTGKTVPKEIKSSRMIGDQWAVLYSRLYILYQTADRVNKKLRQREKFPITLTVGSTRKVVRRRFARENVMNLPQTDNILIGKRDEGLFLCDFGPYLRWEEEMTGAYDEILKTIGQRQL